MQPGVRYGQSSRSGCGLPGCRERSRIAVPALGMEFNLQIHRLPGSSGATFSRHRAGPPGFRVTPGPEQLRDVSDLAYLYLDLFEQMKLENVLLVGASFGGWIASEIAVRCTTGFPDWSCPVRSASRLATARPATMSTSWRLMTCTRGVLEFVDPAFQSTGFASWSDEDLLIAARGREAEVYYGWKPFMHNPQLKHWLHRIDVPTLVLRGADDRIVAGTITRLIGILSRTRDWRSLRKPDTMCTSKIRWHSPNRSSGSLPPARSIRDGGTTMDVYYFTECPYPDAWGHIEHGPIRVSTPEPAVRSCQRRRPA